MSLARYHAMRSFPATPEPPGGGKRQRKGKLRFVVQRHHAKRLHYDFRLEYDGVLKSWAVPKGPSLSPGDKRLAVMTEDHPYEYKDFEGVIPPGNYGAGSVIVWDEGTYDGDVKSGLARGYIRITLDGVKLRGTFVLMRIDNDQWLLMKQHDVYAAQRDITKEEWSVKTARKNNALEGKRTPMPHNVRPMLAATADEPFDRAGWLFELKWDGYRAIAEVDGKKVTMYSRRQVRFDQFPEIEEALRGLKHRAVFDGELVMLDEEGIPRFQLLQQFLEHGEHNGRLMYVMFDLLYLDGNDIRSLPLRERKRLLAGIIPKGHERLRYSEHIVDRGCSLFILAEQKGLEGIIAKDAESKYREGRRTSDWLKIRARARQEAIICGFTEGRGSQKYFGAIILGLYEDDGSLRYIGHTGTGFTDRERKALWQSLCKLETDASPFAYTPKTNAPATWVTPKLVCEIEFHEWTEEGHMRQPVFLGMRLDKTAKEIREDHPQHVEGDFSHLDKVYWPKDGYTKRDVLMYYHAIAPVILPYLHNRPESLLRHPGGITGESFYQKNVDEHIPEGAETIVIPSESSRRPIRYILCQNEETLLYLANLGCIELNPWHARRPRLLFPDYAVIDLDPHNVPFDDVVKTARMVHAVLDEFSVPSYCKTSGKTGLHIYIPLGAKYHHDVARQFAELLCMMVQKRLPEITTLERRLDRRPNAVYLDYLQNRHAQTLAAAYCVRPVDGAPVSAPLKWSEVRKGLDPMRFTMKTMPKRIEKVGDLWKPVLGQGVDVEKILTSIQKKSAPAGR